MTKSFSVVNRKLRWIGIAIILGAVHYLFQTPILIGCGHWLDVGQEPTQADYVFVLPGNEQTRPFVAAALINKGYANLALIPSNQASPEVEDGLELPAQEKIRQVLLARGVDESQVQVLNSATQSTWSDGEALAEFLGNRPPSTILVVTDHFHTRRSRWVLQQVIDREQDQLVFVAAPTDSWNLDNWWQSKHGLNTILTEYFKFTFYLFCYGDWRAWGALLLVLVAAGWYVNRRILAGKKANDGDEGPGDNPLSEPA